MSILIARTSVATSLCPHQPPSAVPVHLPTADAETRSRSAAAIVRIAAQFTEGELCAKPILRSNSSVVRIQCASMAIQLPECLTDDSSDRTGCHKTLTGRNPIPVDNRYPFKPLWTEEPEIFSRHHRARNSSDQDFDCIAVPLD